MSTYFNLNIKTWFFLCLVLICIQCQKGSNKKDIERAFYYWKTTFSLNQEEHAILDSLKINKLYIRYFDVDWNDNTQMPFPKAPISFKEIPNCKVVPVIFITNKTMLNTVETELPQLAKIIISKVNALHANTRSFYEEIQLDCDWSGKSRDNYFKLLFELKKILGKSKVLSATIRLHQVKFSDRTGVPPVDKGMLMVYNMAAINDINTVNSIFDAEIVSQYTNNLTDYPLPLDLAFPIYNQNLLFRAGRYIGVWREKNIFDPDLSYEHFVQFKTNKYNCTRDTFMYNIFIKRGDIIRVEKSDLIEVKNVRLKIQNQFKRNIFTLVLFDLNSNHLKNKSIESIENVFSE